MPLAMIGGMIFVFAGAATYYSLTLKAACKTAPVALIGAALLTVSAVALGA